MTTLQQGFQERDPEIWKLAQARASFRSHIAIYVIMVGVFWAIWFFTGAERGKGLPWPAWPMLGWGIGVAFHYIGAYVTPKSNSVEKEYQKLMNQKTNQ